MGDTVNALNLGAGVNPDVLIHQGMVLVGYQTDPHGPVPGRVVVWLYSLDLRQATKIGEVTIGTEASACPRFLVVGETVYLAHKTSGPGYALQIRPVLNLDVVAETFGLGVVGHLAVRGDVVAWQQGAPGWVWRSTALAEPVLVRASDDAEGLSHMTEDGSVVLRYENRFSRPDLGTKPVTAGPVTLAESIRGGLEGRWAGKPGALRPFPGGDCNDPHASFADGRAPVVTWGTGGIWLDVLTEADLIPLIEPVVIEPIRRPCWWGWFKVGDAFDPSGAWRSQPQSWCHVETLQAAHEAIGVGLCVVGPPDVVLSPLVQRNRVAAIWVKAPDGENGDLRAIERACRAVRDRLRGQRRPPILAYIDRRLSLTFDIPSADWIGPQCYREPGEPMAKAQEAFEWELACAPAKPIVPHVQGWDRRSSVDGPRQPIAEVEALQAVWPRLVNRDPRVIGALVFAWGRSGGGVEHPSIARLQAELVRGIQSRPAVETLVDPPIEEPPPKEKKVYRIPRDIIAAGLAELRRIYDVHLRETLNDEGLAAWLFDVWVYAIYQGPDPGGNAGWQSRLAAANRAMRKAIQSAVPNPPGEGWPSDPS